MLFVPPGYNKCRKDTDLNIKWENLASFELMIAIFLAMRVNNFTTIQDSNLGTAETICFKKSLGVG